MAASTGCSIGTKRGQADGIRIQSGQLSPPMDPPLHRVGREQLSAGEPVEARPADLRAEQKFHRVY